MKIAVTTVGPSLDDQVEARFGRAPYYLFVDLDTMDYEAVPNPNVAAGGGAGIQSAQLMSERGVEYVLTGNCGPNAFQVFSAAGVQVVVGVRGSAREAVDAFRKGVYSASNQPSVESHFGMGGGPGTGMDMGGGRGMDMGGGRGMGMGGGRGMGMGGGRGMGMGGGRGMGMGKGQGMGRGIGGGQPGFPDTAAGRSGTLEKNGARSLQEEARILEERLADIRQRIDAIQKDTGTGIARVDTQKCNGCGICVEYCPVEAITMNDVAVIDEKKCTGCEMCIDACPLAAITMI
ncbi:MAG: 4Fe-4S binding protein [Deltaproteobacteria bacterium]|nr:4Fe-4S binding protein [Deltaproteobacteria bacterium]